MKSKRTYKIIACVSIWLSVIIAAFSLAIAKPKAGVIVNTNYSLYSSSANVVLQKDFAQSSGLNLGFLYYESTASTIYYAAYPANSGYNNTSYSYFNIRCEGFRGDISTKFLLRLDIVVPNQYASQTGLTSVLDLWYEGNITTYNDNTYFLIDYNKLILKLSADYSNWQSFFNNNNYELRAQSSYNAYFFTSSNSIAICNNIYDLKQNDVALIYISDISGLSSTMTEEIAINWGYIDQTDNNIFSVYDSKISAQLLEADDLLIRLSVPTNNTGTTANTYDISQQAILSIGTGSATATAHIYGVYVWIQNNRIQWGIAEFDTTSTPASANSMNYITSLTSLYDYTAINTQTMTCRLSISDNFNFITIKNQPILSAYNINTVIQQGGFLPAWSLYNWARGSASGFISGEQAGAAPYQPGNTGYQEIFEAGRQAGINENVGTVNWFVSAFQAVDAMLNIRIFPNITIGYLVGIPFVISVVWFIVRMFRGGGSSS